MQELTQAHRLLCNFAAATFLHLAEAVNVDVALVDAKAQVLEVLDGPT